MASDNIDIIGTLQNKTEEGFDIKNSMSEKIDNSLDWKSNNIIIKLDTKTKIGIIGDDGTAMDTGGLEFALRLNGCSEPSNLRQGKYGIGLPQSLVVDTQLNGTAQIISRPRNTDTIYSIKIDYKKCIKDGKYITIATEASSAQERIFNENTISGYGTVIVVEFDKNKLNDLVSHIKSSEIQSSLIYEFGFRYSDYNLVEKRIQFCVDDEWFTVLPVDPLCKGRVPVEDTQLVECLVYNNGTQYRVWYTKNGKLGYNEKPKKRIRFTNCDVIPAEWKFVGRFTVESAYSSNWDLLQADIIKYIEDDDECEELVETEQRQNRVHERSKYMGGRYYNRNDKCIDRVSIEQPTTGDKSKYKYVTDSRHKTRFPVELDRPFDIQVNKSRIREDNIDPEILMTILQIANDFATKMYKKYCPKNDPEPDPEPDPELSPEPSPKLAPVPSFEPSPKLAPVPSFESDSVPSFEPDSEPSPKLATEPTFEPVPQPTVKPSSEPTFEPVPQPTAKPSSEPTIKPSSELTFKPDSEPSPKLASEPSFEPDPEPNPNLPHNIVIYDVGPSQHTTISVQYGLELINTLTKETTIDILLLLYFDRCARDQIQLMCEALHGKITEKKEILLRMIRARYLGNLSTDMLGGAELIKNL